MWVGLVRPFFVCLLLVSCSSQVPCEPIFEMPERVASAFEGSDEVVVDAPWPLLWWELFDDPQLNRLVSCALENNPFLQLSETKVRIACLMKRRAEAPLYPHFNATTSFNKELLTRTGIFPDISEMKFAFLDIDLFATLQWNLDIWGQQRDRVAAACGFAQAEKFCSQVAQLALSVAVANSYFEWQIVKRLDNLSQGLIASIDKEIELTEEQVNHNLASLSELNAKKITKKEFEELQREYQLSCSLFETEIETLIASDAKLSIDEAPFKLSFPLPVPETVSLDLAGRRPDIQAKLWLIYSSRKEIDVAQKEFYPNLNLVGQVGLSTIELTKFFENLSFAYSINPAVTLPIFQGGELCTNLSISQELYRLQVQEYNELVLQAAKELVNSLNSLVANRDEWLIAKEQLFLQNEQLQLAEARVKQNLSNRQNSLLLEREVLKAEMDLANREGRAVLSMLSLINAGGG